MKVLLSLLFVLKTTTLFAQGYLSDYRWTLTDVLKKGQTKENLLASMDREFVKIKGSICSNRAHMWVNDFKRKYDLDTAKIFVFYTTEEDHEGRLKVWWYHVAPIVNENNQQFILDPAFSASKALTKDEWFQKISRYKTCREMKSDETELIELIFTQRTFPKQTPYGTHDCYYRIVPHPYWIPKHIAENLLGVDSAGKAVRVERTEIDKDELMQSCLESTSSKVGYALGSSKKKCKEYIELGN